MATPPTVPRTQSRSHARLHPSVINAVINAAIDAGFAILLVVCALRYFGKHPLAGEGTVVLTLAIGAGVSYAVAVLGTRATNAPVSSRLGTVGTRQRVGLLVATGLWFPLVVLAPSFGWCAFALFFAVHRVLRGTAAFVVSGMIVVAVSVGLFIMSAGQDLGLVLGPLFGGFVLASAYAALDRALADQQKLIAQLIDTREQLSRTEREAGALAERGRVASELHDTVVQRTASTLLLLETDDLQPGGSAPLVGEARETLRDALVHTRQLMLGLADPRETAGSLTDSVRAVAAANAATFAVVGEERAVADVVAHALLRVVQEALLNAQRHASADTVRVTLTYFDDTIGVDIADNGVGFLADAPPARTAANGIVANGIVANGIAADGFGVRAMTWRVQNLGGQLTIESQPGYGTVVAAVVPYAGNGENR